MGPLKLMQAVQTGFRPTIRDDCPQHLRNLSELCWVTDPKRRLTARQVIEYLESAARAGNGTQDPLLVSGDLLPRSI
jgi:hypothetical protein